MPKYIVKEGILDKFLGGVFTAIGKGAAKKVVKKLAFDPELQKMAKKADDALKDIEKHIEDHKKRDPEWAAEFEKIKNL